MNFRVPLLITFIILSSFGVIRVSGASEINASSLNYVEGEKFSQYGETITGIGDYNGDGYGDFIVGGRAWEGWRGKVWGYFGSSDGIETNATANFMIKGEPNRGKSGICMGHTSINLGDINGDGIDDFGVGGPGSWGLWDVGKVYVFSGGNETTPEIASERNTEFQSPINYDWFGESMNTAGDFDGNGLKDFIVGAPGSAVGSGSDAPFEVGKAYVFLQQKGGKFESLELDDKIFFSAFGLSVGGGYDVNGDGFDDVVVGAPWDNSAIGKAYLFLGSDQKTVEPAVAFLGNTGQFNFGQVVQIIADMNDDGLAEIAVKSSDLIVDSDVYIYYGREDVSTFDKPDVILHTEEDIDELGRTIQSHSDFNGDGYMDLFLGAPGGSEPIGEDYAGALYIYFGGPDFDEIADVTFSGAEADDVFGFSSAAEDVNGDGRPDLLIGALGAGDHKGRVFIYLGEKLGTTEIILISIGGVLILLTVYLYLRRRRSFNQN